VAAHNLSTNASINIYFWPGHAVRHCRSMTNDIVHYGLHSWSISKIESECLGTGAEFEGRLLTSGGNFTV